ncbi:MAG: DUF4424 family protein, partial [Actinomycetia bacterium]|nr:DUF4424 family protein [Actinomycetes bacterium]
DDSFLGGVGGALKPQNSEDIIMEEETVKIKMTKYGADVECEYIFRNTGPAQTVVMGFPEIRDEEGEMDSSPVENFKAYDKDKPLAVEVKEIPIKEENQGYKYWYTHKVIFDAGETKTVRNTFHAPLSGSIADFSVTYIRYILETGSTWKGNIGKITVEAELSGDLTLSDLIAPSDWFGMHQFKKGEYGIYPPGYKIVKPNKIGWEFKNLEPVKEHNIYIAYFESFYRPEASEDEFKDNVSYSFYDPLENADIKLPLYHQDSVETQSEEIYKRINLLIGVLALFALSFGIYYFSEFIRSKK